MAIKTCTLIQSNSKIYCWSLGKKSSYTPHFHLTVYQIQPSFLSRATQVLNRQPHLREDKRQKSWFICLQGCFKSQLQSVTLPSAYFCVSKLLGYNYSAWWTVKHSKFDSKFVNFNKLNKWIPDVSSVFSLYHIENSSYLV